MELLLEQLFTLVQEGTHQFKAENPQGDGRAFWQPMKRIFGEQNIQASTWQALDPELVTKLINLPEYDDLGNMILLNHFLRQQVRIPTQEEPSLRKIMQIALNSGQYVADIAHQNRHLGLQDFNYNQSGLSYLETYISKAEIAKLSTLIPGSLIEEVETYLRSQLKIKCDR